MSYALRPHTIQAFNNYLRNIASVNGVAGVVQTFAVAPAPAQRIIQAYQLSVDFLQLINVLTVANGHGEKIGLLVGTSIASTNSSSQTTPRIPVSVGDTELFDEYLCTQTNYDVAYKYQTLDAWSQDPNFAPKLANMVVRAIALDKLKIGWNGTHRVPTSDRSAFPLLQDVNKGWLQKIREFAPQRVFSGTETSVGSGVFELHVGAGQEFKTLDGLVQTAIEELIAIQFRDDKSLIAICGRNILADKYLPLLNTVYDPINQVYAKTLYAGKTLGTLQALTPPGFPADKILITSPDNLSIYIQDGSIRRRIVDEAHYDRYADYQSANESFVVEDYNKAALIENIIVDEA